MISTALLAQLEALQEYQDWNEASGIVIEVQCESGYRQLVGPFDKETVEAFDAIEVLMADEDPDAAPNTYTPRLLFPAYFAARVGDQ